MRRRAVRFGLGWLSMVLSTALSTMLLATLAALPAGAATQGSAADRQGYSDAVQAIDSADWSEYRRLRGALDDYPLAIYLDYFQLTRDVSRVRSSEARDFVTRSSDSPLPNRFLARYLQRAGRDKRWRDFLAVMPSEPNSIELKCYYFRAQRSAGNLDVAWEGAARLWVHGKSRPKQCDPLFETWLAAGQLTDELVWARMLKVFDARQGSLLRYVARKGSSELTPFSDALLEIYRRPEALRRQTLPAGDSRSADVVAHGIKHLARYNPDKALASWQHYQGQMTFAPEQIRDVEYAMAYKALLSKTDTMAGWLHGALDRLDDDKLVGIRLRWVLGEQDWDALEATLPLLSEAERAEPVWQYWSAVLLERRGLHEAASQAFLALSDDRGYYHFLAADRLSRQYVFQHQSLVLADAGQYLGLPAVQRIEELHFHDEASLAHSEWFKVLQDTADPNTHQELAQVASGQGWHRMAIDAANRAKSWDALDLRFPTPYRKTFESHAANQQVPSTELMAIARRESAFYPEARSPVGARGLMQIMPATGKQVARSLGKRHSSADLYQVEHNVSLGSAYYRQLLDRYGGNRVFALAAYNAGPHRVDRWRNKPGQGVPVDIWVETIPYRETRNYVQAVLSYNVVFQYLLGDTRRLLTPEERAASY